MSRLALALALALTSSLFALGCGDDSSLSDGSMTDPDAGATPDGSTIDDGSSTPDTSTPPPTGAPCDEGPIAGLCACGGADHESGFCCNDLWFDPYYETLVGGCPGADAYRYVDPGHAAASDENPGTADAPWATIEHGVATVVGGQILVVREGTYPVATTGSRYEPALNPANSGSAAAPVILKADGAVVVRPAVVARGTARGGSPENIVLAGDAPSEDQAFADHHVRIVSGTGAGQSRMILRDFDDLARTSYDGATRTAWINVDGAGSGNWDVVPDATSEYELVRNGPILGTNGREHVVWDGFIVREQNAYHPDTGPVVLWDSTDVALLNCDVGASAEHLFDNHNAVRINGSTRAVVRNNRIHGVEPIDVGRNNPQNHAAIMIYLSDDLVIENNEIYDSYTGIFPKGEYGGHVIRYNEIHDCEKAIRVSYHDDVTIYGNVIHDVQMALQGAEENDRIRFFNNTVHRSEWGLYNWFAIHGVSVFNNVFSEVANPVYCEAEPGTFGEHHDVVHDYVDFVIANENVGGLATWRSMGYGDGTENVDPGFLDPASGDYRLSDGSGARTVGVDLEDLDGDGDTAEAIPAGAYVTGSEVVGLVR